MATKLNVYRALPDAARSAGGHPTKREAAITALRQYVARIERAKRIATPTHAFAPPTITAPRGRTRGVKGDPT